MTEGNEDHEGYVRRAIDAGVFGIPCEAIPAVQEHLRRAIRAAKRDVLEEVQRAAKSSTGGIYPTGYREALADAVDAELAKYTDPTESNL